METSFISGSENLYKYLVSIGILMIILSIFYPLKEKQELEIVKINTKKEALALNFQINEVNKEVQKLKNQTNDIDREALKKMLDEIEDLHIQNQLSQYELEKKYEEIEARTRHIRLYHWLFWISLPVGILFLIYGFIKWLKSKTIDDQILELEKRNLELTNKKLEREDNES